MNPGALNEEERFLAAHISDLQRLSVKSGVPRFSAFLNEREAVVAARAVKGEKLKLNMNDYMLEKFPDAYRLASTVCGHLEKYLKKPLDEVEIGYLAMHIQRVSEE